MKLAFFSPFPPKQTGVAAYSQALVSALRATTPVTAFDHNNPDFSSTDGDAVDFATAPETILRLQEWDATIFSLGNNPHYHLEILRVFMRTRGILLLHDTVLYFLFAGLRPGAFYHHFCHNFGLERSGEIQAIRAESPEGDILRYPHPERYTFLGASLQYASAVVVHSEFAAEIVRGHAPAARVHLLPHLALSPAASPSRTRRAAELRSTLLKRPGQTLLGTFGFLGPTKRLPSICAALLLLQQDADLHLVIVGEGPDPLPDFLNAGLKDRVTWLRYVSDEDFDAWIEATDIVLNLRYPSMGESSGSLSRAMSMGKSCVVTDYATFAEYPDATVWKIPHGEGEVNALANAIRLLSRDATKRDQIGAAAKHHLATVHAPEKVAARLLEIVAETARVDSQREASSSRTNDAAAARIRKHLLDTVEAALPSHLRNAGNSTPCDQLPPPVAFGLTAEELTWTFRVLLMREPHPELEVPHLLKDFHSVAQLRETILKSEEFRRLGNSS